MITYLYGFDKYRIKQYLQEHAAGAMVGEEALKTKGLFDQAPVILYDPPKSLNIPDDVEVFVVSEKKIKKGVEFKPLQGDEIRQWIQGELKKEGFAIASDALALLAVRYVDSWQTKLELEKLCNYAQEKKRIEKRDLDAVSNVTIEENIFKLTDAIANKHKGEALLLLDRQLANGADPYYLFSMVVFQFRNMLAPGRTGVHPYVASKARMASQRFDDGKLKKLYQNLHQLELDAKKGEHDMEQGLYQFVFSL
ncbi:MAG: hypothetical protein AAB420_01740 [Patescibacteria group bacterium]